MNDLNRHHGNVIEYVVRRKGFNISELATMLGVNRRSVYNWFQSRFLKTELIFRVGCAIRHDFSKEFPELFNKNDFSCIEDNPTLQECQAPGDAAQDLISWRDKYLTLLETYNGLLLKAIEKQKSSKDDPSSESSFSKSELLVMSVKKIPLILILSSLSTLFQYSDQLFDGSLSFL